MIALVIAALIFAGVDVSPWERVTATVPATREASLQPATTPPTLPPEPWQGMEGTYQCRYGLGVTPCCPQWWDLALDVGWPREAMAKLDYVMGRESTCDPSARGPLWRGKRAQGLTQLLGWDCPPDGCLDPRSNLAKALELWQVMGWRPWCLDAITGRC